MVSDKRVTLSADNGYVYDADVYFMDHKNGHVNCKLIYYKKKGFYNIEFIGVIGFVFALVSIKAYLYACMMVESETNKKH